MRSPNVKCIYPTQCAFSSHARSGSCARRLLIHAHWNFRLYTDLEKSRTQTVVFASSAHVQACHILSESMMQNIDPIWGSEKELHCDETRRMLPVCQVHRSIVRTHCYTDSILPLLQHFGLESLGQELLTTHGIRGPGDPLPSE